MAIQILCMNLRTTLQSFFGGVDIGSSLYVTHLVFLAVPFAYAHSVDIPVSDSIRVREKIVP